MAKKRAPRATNGRSRNGRSGRSRDFVQRPKLVEPRQRERRERLDFTAPRDFDGDTYRDDEYEREAMSGQLLARDEFLLRTGFEGRDDDILRDANYYEE